MPRALRAAALLASAARAWDVRTPTNTTCLGGCACVPRLRACVPTAPAKDARVLALSLASLARHGADVAEVWVVSRRAAGVDAAVAAANRVRPVARWLDEAAHFPFDYAGVRAALGAARGRAPDGGGYQYAVGWYLQQLLKLYCGRAIARAARNTTGAGPGGGGGGGEGGEGADVLVADSDVVWTRDVAFVHAAAPDAGGACRATYNYAFSREAHQLYYDTNARLLGAAGAPLADSAGRDISGVAHHMVLRGDVVAALEAAVAARHGAPLHAALFRGAAGVAANARRNAFSEYQLYFHFARRRFPASVRVRQLYWANGPGPRAVAACGADGGPPPRCGRWVTPRRPWRSIGPRATTSPPTTATRSGGRASTARRPTPPTAARASGAAARGPASRAASTSGSSAGTAPRRLRGSAPLGNFLRLLPSPWPLLGPLPRSLGPRESRPLGPWPLGPRRAYPYRTRTGGTGFRRERDGEIGSCAR